MNSINEFGFITPVIIDENNMILVGHGRTEAAKIAGLDKVPFRRVTNLSDDQKRAYILTDNKLSDLAEWDEGLLMEELEQIEIDMRDFGFEEFTLDGDDFFGRSELDGNARQEGNEEYNEFVEKFEPKKTTDDCYTPEIVYDAVVGWVENEFDLKREDFVRPFYPGGDYQSYKYVERSVVVDNPPFSILSEIIRFYTDNGIKFFLFAPTMTLFSSSSSSACSLPCGGKITYENGAIVPTSFVTNLCEERVRVIPELFKIIEAADEENQKQFKKQLPKYKYPDEVLTAAMCRYMCEHDTPLTITKEDSCHIRQLDSQKEYDGSAIFGSGFLLSEKAAAEKAAAEKAAAEKAAATVWKLSDREIEIVKSLGKGK